MDLVLDTLGQLCGPETRGRNEKKVVGTAVGTTMNQC